jgi:NET1-associated nuclear protein 1 (U3 small nucleolar RNA-associated protein 17)
MTPDMEMNGDTASLKRKREPKDDPLLAQKKHRRKSRSKLEGNANSENAASSQTGGDLELPDASSQPHAGPVRGRLATWKVSKPMGGRMRDIDPIFSPDEK